MSRSAAGQARVGAARPARGQSLIQRLLADPVGAKVPEILPLFWLVKILTTAGGEAGSDFLAHYGNVGGGGTVLVVFLAGILLQFGTSRYRAAAYWFFAYSIAIFGTAVADFLHLDVGISYGGTSVIWAVVLLAVFWIWHRREGTLSIHSITTRSRERFYWATVFATFALGTALGDYTAFALHLGYLTSGLLFAGVIALPALAWGFLRLNPVVAFWCAYVVTRPLGASFADYVSKPRHLSGVGFGDGPTFALVSLLVAGLVLYLTVARPDVPSAVPSSGAFEG